MKLEFPRALGRQMRDKVKAAGRREVGGILMAEQLEPGMFRLADFSVDAVTGGAAHFVRSPEHHKRALDSFFHRTGYNYARFNYLGEWHSHPNHAPIPSRQDIEAMNGLVHGERNIPFAALLIMRAGWWHRLQCSAMLFQRGIIPEPVDLIFVR